MASTDEPVRRMRRTRVMGAAVSAVAFIAALGLAGAVAQAMVSAERQALEAEREALQTEVLELEQVLEHRQRNEVSHDQLCRDLLELRQIALELARMANLAYEAPPRTCPPIPPELIVEDAHPGHE